MEIEPDRSKAQAVRPSVSAVIWDGGARVLLQQRSCAETLALGYFDPRGLPDTMLALHRIRIEDALARRSEAFIR